MTTTRMARDFNEIVQWDILFHKKRMVFHFIDEAIRGSVGEPLASKSAVDLVETIMSG